MKLSVKNLTFAYEKSKLIFKDLCFSCESGEVLSVIGRNGVGKTTLIKILLGLLEPKTGEIIFYNGDITYNIEKIKTFKFLSYVPQQSNIYKDYTVFDAVLVGLSKYLSAFKIPSNVDMQLVDEILKEMNIYHLKEKHLYEISGGELQLTLISRALISNPKFIILDEPETALDIKNQIAIMRFLYDLAKKKNIIIIFNTHYIDHALNFSDKTLMLAGGAYYFGDSKKIIDEDSIYKTFNIHTEFAKSKSGYVNINPIM